MKGKNGAVFSLISTRYVLLETSRHDVLIDHVVVWWTYYGSRQEDVPPFRTIKEREYNGHINMKTPTQELTLMIPVLTVCKMTFIYFSTRLTFLRNYFK